MIGCYSLVLIINLVGLFDLPWGTQLYIQILENIIIFGLLIWAGLWEQNKQESDYLSDKKFKQIKLNMMSALDDPDMPEFSKTREHLLSQNEINKLFVERKFAELVELFGDRKAKSAYEVRDKVEDPRYVKTWPVSPDHVPHDGPIEPLPDPYPDNCYSLGLTDEQWQQMKYLSKGMTTKALQSDAYDADYNLRKDATLVGHQRDLADQQIDLRASMEKNKKSRGRKNRYFKQIDNEDHEAGFLLDDDDEGRQENVKARNELLDAAASLEAKRQEENKKLVQEETKQRAVQLTEENLRLKKILEEQRQVDARDQKDIQDRIVQEEKRRQDILSNIEAARRDREARKNAIVNNLNSEKETRMQEIEKMKSD
mmetsp:Transcript_2499/g.3144  ORF Transcript_2499/g.3144 Transcript_2499/m.3144 type:complete len:370 (+) Transcript_2499:4439-5548(+)